MSTTKKCPKCGYSSDAGFADCPSCGVIISKFLEREKEQKEYEQKESSEIKSSLGNLANAEALKIQQRKEWGEILTGFETKNRYDVMDHMSNPLIEALEEGGSVMSTITRLFLKALRPFTMHLFSPGGNGLFKLTRPFRFYFHELDVCQSNGASLGKIKRKFAILRRIYSVIDRNGNEMFELFGPLLHPWTFQIKKGGLELGKITKKWSGLLKETFTNADNFGITFDANLDIKRKALLLGAVFLIDFVHFEKRDN